MDLGDYIGRDEGQNNLFTYGILQVDCRDDPGLVPCSVHGIISRLTRLENNIIDIGR